MNWPAKPLKSKARKAVIKANGNEASSAKSTRDVLLKVARTIRDSDDGALPPAAKIREFATKTAKPSKPRPATFEDALIAAANAGVEAVGAALAHAFSDGSNEGTEAMVASKAYHDAIGLTDAILACLHKDAGTDGKFLAQWRNGYVEPNGEPSKADEASGDALFAQFKATLNS